jgi:DNA-binding XRE family transcriptional regulator
MSDFDSYRNSFPHAKLTRTNGGVLELVLHTNGDTLIFSGQVHEEFVELFHEIGADAETRVVILTGAGNAFIDNIESDGFDFFTPRGYDKIYREGKKTQEELAEYLGVSRTWYGLLESKKPVRVSLVLLDRLSAALMLTREERARLFALALPELDFPEHFDAERYLIGRF